MKVVLTFFLVFYTLISFAQVEYFSDRDAWHTGFEGTLLLEDFQGGPTKSGNSGCDGDFSAIGNSCFPEGEIQPGIVITSSDTTSGHSMAYTNVGFVSNPTPIVGSNKFEDYTIVNFPDENINTVGLELYGAPAASVMHVRLYGSAGDLVDSLTITEGMPGPYFFGFRSNEPIVSMEFQGEGFAVEMVGMVEFGVYNVVSVNDLKDFDLTIFPNPAKNTLRINANSEITSVSIVNILGQVVVRKENTSNFADVDISNLDSGAYFVKTQIAGRTGVYKLLKE